MTHYDRRGVVIRDAEEADIASIVERMRRKDAEEVLAEGSASTHDAVALSFAASTVRLTALRDGIPVAMFGLVPDALLGSKARVWLLGAEGLGGIKKTFVRMSRVVIAHFLERYPLLYNRVDCRYEETIRWLKACGAEFQAPSPVGPQQTPFQIFTIRRA